MIICVGEAVIDMIYSSDSINEMTFKPIPGGCPYNSSIAISRLGAPVSFLGRISNNFFGEIQIKRLRENNVRDDMIIRCIENPVLSFIKIEKGLDPEYAFYEEGTSDRLLCDNDIPVMPDDASCIVFGSISMAMEPIATTIENLIIKEAEKKVISFDPNIRPFIIKNKDEYLKRFKKWVSLSTIVKISLEDFQYITPDLKPDQALEELVNMGAKLAILTLGDKGVMAMRKQNSDNTEKIKIPGIPVKNISDTVGAGDTFHGAFLAWLESRNLMSNMAINNLSAADLTKALTFANKAAAFVCTKCGADPPYLEELEKI